MKTNKKYPFGTRKHQHDIEYFRNRVYNLLSETDASKEPEQYKRLDDLYEKLTELLCEIQDTFDGRISYLTGEQLGLAKRCINWANVQRAEIMIAKGQLKY